MHPTPTPPAGATLSDVRGSYRLALRARGLAERTVDLYLEALDSFAAYGAAHDQPADVAAIRRPHIEVLEAVPRDDAEEWPTPAAFQLRYAACPPTTSPRKNGRPRPLTRTCTAHAGNPG